MDEPPVPDLDPDTLRESYRDPAAVAARTRLLRTRIREAPDEVAELLARGELVDLLRGSGELDAALEEGERAVARAELTGAPPQQHLARLRLATVRQWRGEFVESNLAFTELQANLKQFGPVIEAFTHEAAGKNAYDQGHYADAYEHFAQSVAIREQLELPPEQIVAARVALGAARRRRKEEQP
jgi:hypothetical protein